MYCWGGNEYQQCGLVSAEDAAVADAQPGNSSSSNGGGAQQQQQWMYQDSRGQLLPQDSRGRRWQRGSNGALIAGGAYGVLPAARDILVPLKCMPGLKVKQVRCAIPCCIENMLSGWVLHGLAIARDLNQMAQNLD